MSTIVKNQRDATWRPSWISSSKILDPLLELILLWPTESANPRDLSPELWQDRPVGRTNRSERMDREPNANRPQSPYLIAALGLLTLVFLFLYNRQPMSFASWIAPGGAQNYRTLEEYLLINCIALLAPIFVCWRSNEQAFGLQAFDPRTGWGLAAVMVAVMLPIVWFAAGRQEFQNYYPIDRRALQGWQFAIYFWAVYGFYMFCWEFFFRGFLALGLYPSWGVWAVLAQAVAFAVMHIGKPWLEVFGSFGAGLVLGMVAVRTKSFLPCFIAHWAVSIWMDVSVMLQRG